MTKDMLQAQVPGGVRPQIDTGVNQSLICRSKSRWQPWTDALAFDDGPLCRDDSIESG
jgi:hypothetical protein